MKTVMREKQWAEKYPDLGTEPVPTEPYVSDEHYELERERIFRRCWINVGRVDEIPNPGDYFVRDIAICKTSVLIIRGSDGVVRGFFNVCSHRGNTLVLDGRGTCPGSVYCHFHNWVYSDTGALIRVPDEENFFDFDKRDHGLTPVNTDFWEGFVFVHLGTEPAETLREYLGGVADQLDGCPFHEMPLMQTYLVDERANWKVGLDAQNELYHLPFQHRRILGDAFLMNDKGHCRFQDVNLYNYHTVWSCEYDPTHKLTPLGEHRLRLGEQRPGHPHPADDRRVRLLRAVPEFRDPAVRGRQHHQLRQLQLLAACRRPHDLGNPHALQEARGHARALPAGILQVSHPRHAAGGPGRASERARGPRVARQVARDPAG